ncbi:MAG: ABC transporter permease [Ruminiclostridium sp.]|nr:ABC transporter permease [Ruminiclostridium sp.]
MRAYIAFSKKEFMESIRTYKLLIMVLVFLLFGMMSPLAAKLAPKLLETLVTDGIQIIIPEPTALDSWAQFFKNVSQMGIIVLVILFSGMMANEFNRGTLINVLTKGLQRSTVILSKFTMACVIWTFSYFLCFGVCYAYTAYFWGGNEIANLMFSVVCLWQFGILILAAMILGGVLFNNSYGCLLFTGGFAAILLLMNIAPKLQKYNPAALASYNMPLLAGDTLPKDLTAPLTISIAIVMLFIVIAIRVFDKKQV